MDEATGHACPLCRRELGISEVDLFKQYHALLVGELEEEISAIKTHIVRAGELATAVGQVDRLAWDKYKTISDDILNTARINSDIIVKNCDVTKNPTADAKAALASLKSAVTDWATQLGSKMTAIETAEKGRDELVKQLTILRGEIETLEYAQAIAGRMQVLKAAQNMVEWALLERQSPRVYTGA